MSAPCILLRDEVIVDESGLCYFTKTKKCIDFKQRVNYAQKIAADPKQPINFDQAQTTGGQLYLFGLQDGSIRLLTDNVEWKSMYQSPNKKEITCWGYNVDSKDNKILIGTGFI